MRPSVCRALAAAALVLPTLLGTAFGASGAATTGPSGPALSGVMTPSSVAGPVRIALTDVSPTVLTDGDELVVSGTVTNNGTDPVGYPTVRLVLGTIDSTRPAVAAWARASGPARGTLLTHTRLATLAPGASSDFELRVKDLVSRGKATYGSLPLSVEVGASAVRTFAGYQRIKQYQPMSIAWAVPLTLDPDPNLFGAVGASREAAWTSALSPGSRLRRVLDATSATAVTWGIDPTLTPGLLPDPVDTGVTGSKEHALRSEVQDLIAAAARRHTPWVLPDTDADLGALAASDTGQGLMRTLVDRAANVAQELGARSDIAWPVDGGYSAPREAALRRVFRVPELSAQVTAASTLAGPSAATPGASQRSPGGLPLLSYDDALSALLARTTTGPETVLSTQQFVADSAALLNELPGTAGRSVLVVAPRRFNPDPEAAARFFTSVAAIPWLTPTNTDTLLARARRATPGQPPVTRPPESTPGGTAVLTPSRIAALERTVATVRGVAQIRDDGDEFARTWTRAAEQLASARWRGSPTAWSTLSSSVTNAARETTSAVTVSASTVNFLAESGRLQITVRNDLDVPVENVKLTVEASNPRLRIDRQPPVLRIGPKSRATVTVSVTALAAGSVPLRTTLTTPDGTVIGQGADVVVRVTPTGNWVYGALGAVGGLILLLGLVRTFRKRPGRRHPTTDPAEPTDPAPSPRAEPSPTPSPAATPSASTPAASTPTVSTPTASTPTATTETTGTTGTGSERTLASSSAVMAGGTAVSRLLGFWRTALVAGTIGIGLSGDAFDVANTLPNQFYLLLAGGVLNAVLVPQITKAATHDDGGHVFVNRLLTLSFAVLVVSTVVATALAPLLVRLFSQGWDQRTTTLATAFAVICIPQILFYGIYTVLGQVLNARGQFAAYMWAPAIANVVAIAGLLWFGRQVTRPPDVDAWTGPMIWVIAGSATLGVAAQALALLVPLRRSGFRYRPVWGFRGVGLRSASRVALWTFAALAVSQLGFVVTSRVLTRANDLIASQHLSGGAGKAAYSAAFLLFMLPHSLITLSLVTALFTRMSRAAHAGDTSEVVDDLGRGLRMPAVLLVPGTVAAVLLGQPAVHLVFFKNTPEQTQAIAQVMIAMMVGLVPYGWLYLIQRVYYAYEDARTPFRLQVVVTVVATCVNLYAFTVDPTKVGIVVGVGQTVSNLAAALLGFVLLRRRLGLLRLRSSVRLYARLLAASVVGALVCWPLTTWLSSVLSRGRMSALLELAVGGGAYLAVVLVLAHLMRVEEVTQLLAPILRRVRRHPS